MDHLILEVPEQSVKKYRNAQGWSDFKYITAYHEFEVSLQHGIDQGEEKPGFAIVVCDINYLKHINDTYGHKAGDEYIKSACKMIFDVFSHSPVFRVGGDEFVVILTGTDYERRNALMEEIHEKVLENQRIMQFRPVVAVGMSVYDKAKDHKVIEVFERADKEMYQNKDHLKKLLAESEKQEN